MPEIKLCGMMKDCDIDFANEAEPDYIGFVFYENSFRNILFKTAERFKYRLNQNIKSVGVFVNEEPENIISLYENGIINLAQLHGDEDERYIEKLKSKANNLEIIKAVRIRNSCDIINAEKSLADFLLYDAYKKGIVGGTGESFEWGLTRLTKRKFFLAGGLTIENILTAAKTTGAYCVDISSGIETDNKKDKIKMCEAVRRIRNG